MSNIKMERVSGTLIRDGGERMPVQLMLTVVSLPGSNESEVSECALASRNVPDGNYTLEYFYRTPRRNSVPIQDGVLIGRP